MIYKNYRKIYMKTVDRILREIYPERLVFNRQERRYLTAEKVTNGLWAAGGINFWDLLRDTIKYFPQFEPEKIEDFIKSAEKCSGPHDVIYLEGNKFMIRIKADHRFALSIKKLCHWTTKKKQRRIYLVIFFALLFRGGKAFNYGKKKDIYDILPNNIKSWE